MIRKTVFFLSQKAGLLRKPFRQMRARLYFKNAGVTIGKAVLLKGLSYQIQTGSDVHFYDNCIVEMVGDAAALTIGNSCLFSYGVLISGQKSISIGSNVMVGEYSSIRDTTHSYADSQKPMKNSADVSAAVIIGDDVWIGRGCLVMPGTIIEDGVVVAANSVVKGRLEQYSLYGGTPARLIRKR